MKYVSLDLETTCLTPNPDHILQVSMVVEDTRQQVPVEQLPHFTCFVRPSEIRGQPYALAMNAWILDILSGRATNRPDQPVYAGQRWVFDALDFLDQHFPGQGKITVAGKNVAGFDIPFLPADLRDLFAHRVLDPGPLFVDWSTDTKVPDFATCLARAGLPAVVKHDAYEDALDVIRLFRTRY